jgi:hypothetical protein
VFGSSQCESMTPSKALPNDAFRSGRMYTTCNVAALEFRLAMVSRRLFWKIKNV